MTMCFQSMRWGLMAASVALAIWASGLPTSVLEPQAVHAAVSPSGGTTNTNDLPTMAAAKVKALWPGWTIVSAGLKNGGFVTVGARNPRGTSGVFSVDVVVRNENGKKVYYVGNVRGPN